MLSARGRGGDTEGEEVYGCKELSEGGRAGKETETDEEEEAENDEAFEQATVKSG